MKNHEFWQGIDALARSRQISPSRLATMAGLDPTIFNPSKRSTGPQGKKKPRWLSTETLGKVLEATNVSLEEFASFAAGHQRQIRAPLVGFAQAGNGGFFDDSGFPVGHGWEDVTLPDLADENAYALQISGNSMEPVYRHGDHVLVAPNAAVRRGDRVVVKTRDEEIMAKELGHRDHSVELISLNPDYPTLFLPRNNIVWIARIVWASQ